VAESELPSFDLVVATVGRVEELERLVASIARQTHRRIRVLLVDQNDDDVLDPIVSRHGTLAITRLECRRGLSRARNTGLARIDADLVGFPDDDCVYPDDLLERVAHRFAADAELAGLAGRAADERGDSSASWSREGAVLTRENVWNRAISFTIFLRSSLVAEVGGFDEQLGLGSGTRWSSGEEIDYLVRALDTGARIEYDPSLIVIHAQERRPLWSVGARDGASVGYILRKHRYSIRTVGAMLVRPVAGALLALARRDGARARFHLATLRGRVLGYRS
jgi:GT2 family glycosyltransferase